MSAKVGCRLSFRSATDDGDVGADLVEWDASVTDNTSRRVVVVDRQRRRATTTSVGDEQLNKRVAELLAHRAVQQEVDSVVYQRQNVQQISETGVHFVVERVRNAVEEVRDALREFCDEEQHDDDEQHAGGPGVGSGTTVVSPLAAPQHLPALFGDLQCPDQQSAENGQSAAWYQLHEQRLDPEIQQVHEFIDLVLQFERHHPQ